LQTYDLKVEESDSDKKIQVLSLYDPAEKYEIEFESSKDKEEWAIQLEEIVKKAAAEDCQTDVNGTCLFSSCAPDIFRSTLQSDNPSKGQTSSGSIIYPSHKSSLKRQRHNRKHKPLNFDVKKGPVRRGSSTLSSTGSVSGSYSRLPSTSSLSSSTGDFSAANSNIASSISLDEIPGRQPQPYNDEARPSSVSEASNTAGSQGSKSVPSIGSKPYYPVPDHNDRRSSSSSHSESSSPSRSSSSSKSSSPSKLSTHSYSDVSHHQQKSTHSSSASLSDVRKKGKKGKREVHY